MSYTYLLEVGAASTAACFLDIDQFAPLKLSQKTEQSYCKDNAIGFSQNSQFGMTCKPSTGHPGAGGLTLSAVDSLARILVQQEKVSDSVVSEVGYGASLPASLAKYDPATHSLKTAQCSLLEDSIGCSLTLPRWGSMRNGAVYQQPIVALGMRETEFGYLLPTVNTSGLDGGSNSRKANRKRMMLPTIKAQDSRHASTRHIDPKSPHWESNLGEVLVALTGLKKWSPDFAEWLMGFPIGATASSPLGMDKFHEWLQQHSLYLKRG
ncbi:hypothetical protein UFOVP607_30 [uncultured Caudovirales phage]|uniref:Uncharacterized protein n=1 Tax=uncultured Caudovirales phage TaxID=2100421 RepID=A0A6J5N6C4_9CAUD|nr:hypothetical protein UFOVP607_30 [uncultured Caudovirales phage]